MPNAELPIELRGVKEVLAEGDGWWKSCSGCYETSDGYNVAGFPFSEALGCNLGSGCNECGGLGAVWFRYTDEDHAAFMRVSFPEEAEANAGVTRNNSDPL